MVSYIDTIYFQCNDIVDLRSWVRAFEATGDAIYVGIYTTFRHEDIGYVSAGFPLPESNFTVTLLPNNHNGNHFLLKSRNTGLDYPGHYLSTNEDGELAVLALPASTPCSRSLPTCFRYDSTVDWLWGSCCYGNICSMPRAINIRRYTLSPATLIHC